MTLYYITFTLHYIILYYITLHYITLHYINITLYLHFITLHYITLRYVTLRCIALHFITLHYVTLRYVTLRYVMLRYTTLRYVSLCCMEHFSLPRSVMVCLVATCNFVLFVGGCCMVIEHQLYLMMAEQITARVFISNSAYVTSVTRPFSDF